MWRWCRAVMMSHSRISYQSTILVLDAPQKAGEECWVEAGIVQGTQRGVAFY